MLPVPSLPVIIDVIKDILRHPETPRFAQALSGIIAGRRDYLMKLRFGDDYGVDVGLLLDAAEAAAVKAAMQAAVRSAGRIAVGGIGMLVGRRVCVWQVGRQAKRARTQGGGASLPLT